MDTVVSLTLQIAPAGIIIELIESSLTNWPSIAAQDELARQLSIQHVAAFPPPVRGWKYLFKELEKNIRSHHSRNLHENDGNEDGGDLFSDALMELIVESQCMPVPENNDGHLSFQSISLSSIYIPIKVIQSHNQVGTKVWGAGVYLGELFQRVPQLLAGQTVLELGAGVGITGLLISRALPCSLRPAKVIMTDFHFEVVDLLAYNIAINTAVGLPAEESACNIEADTLDWGSVQESDFIRYNARIMFVADCTYSEIGNVHLVHAFKLFLHTMRAASTASTPTPSTQAAAPTGSAAEPSTDAHSGDLSYCEALRDRGAPFILIACTVRNIATYQHFRRLIDCDAELRVVNLTQWAAGQFPAVPTYYYPEDRSRIDLLCIHLIS
jgi:predicted nicotinamide N-methyase